MTPPATKTKAKATPAKKRGRPARGTAIVLKEPVFSNNHRFAPPGPADRRRHFLHVAQGLSIEEISGMEKASVLAVSQSLQNVAEYKYSYSADMLDLKMTEVAMSQMEGVSEVFKNGLKAEKILFVDKETGDTKTAPDTAMQLKTVEAIRSFAETAKPKAPAVQLNQQFNNGQMGGPGGGPGMSFEAILRKKREQAGLKNEQDMETIDAEMEEEEDDEFADFGGDIDDEDEDSE